MQKYYGVFDVCYDSWHKETFDRNKTWIAVRAIEDPRGTLSDKSISKVCTDRSCDEIKCSLISYRQQYKYDDQYRRCHRFRTKYFVHECDKDGFFLPNKREIQAAQELIVQRDSKVAEA